MQRLSLIKERGNQEVIKAESLLMDGKYVEQEDEEEVNDKDKEEITFKEIMSTKVKIASKMSRIS